MKNIWIFLLVLPFLGFSQQNDTIPKKKENQLEEVVISGTLKAVRRLENPVPVEIITATFLKQNPTSNVFDALQNVNGLR
ncbi:MAG TPA: TonB-dependent receptor, partial [Flavobacterium sp.]|nr:TonB-dependent receptor [Flavobacterium sp.]